MEPGIWAFRLPVIVRAVRWWCSGQCESERCSVVSNVLQPRGHSPWTSLGQNIGVGSLSLLQGIFQGKGSNPGLLHCRWILYQLSHQRSPRILEWGAYPFSSGSSQLRNQTGVSCMAGRFFTNRSMDCWNTVVIRLSFSMVLLFLGIPGSSPFYLPCRTAVHLHLQIRSVPLCTHPFPSDSP